MTEPINDPPALSAGFAGSHQHWWPTDWSACSCGLLIEDAMAADDDGEIDPEDLDERPVAPVIDLLGRARFTRARPSTGPADPSS